MCFTKNACGVSHNVGIMWDLGNRRLYYFGWFSDVWTSVVIVGSLGLGKYRVQVRNKNYVIKVIRRNLIWLLLCYDSILGFGYNSD